MNKSKVQFFDKIVMSDRYNGVYSGYKYRVVDKPFENLTQEECDAFNVIINDGNIFYSNWPYGIRKDELLTIKNCRIEAVEKTFENGDVYAGACGFGLSGETIRSLAWITNKNRISNGKETDNFNFWREHFYGLKFDEVVPAIRKSQKEYNK